MTSIKSGRAAAHGEQGSAAKWTHAAMALAVRSLERELGNLARKSVRDMSRENVLSVEIDGERLGKYAGVRALGQSALPNPKPAPQTGSPLTARTKLPLLAPGAYRVRLEGEGADGHTAKIDERNYWFDGKTFEEL